jgi:transposase
MEKIDSRRLPESALNERRRRAVKMRRAGIPVREVARQCELSTHTVVEAHKAFRIGGWKAVSIHRHGRPVGSGRMLTVEQEKKIQRLIQDRTPDQLKLAYALWTRQAVSELIDATYGIRLTVRNMGKYLKRWGFTPQRPLKKAYEQSPEAVAKWVGEEYPQIAKAAKTEGAEILWSDETGLRSDDVRGRGYAPKGKTPVVLANANRAKLSVISTVTNKGQMRWKVFSGALNAKILIGFMKRLVHGRKKRVFLILDNLRVHHSKALKKWLAENQEKIQVFYLPSYSPELNPDELLNADLKQRITKAAPARNKMALTRTAIGSMRSIQKQRAASRNSLSGSKDISGRKTSAMPPRSNASGPGQYDLIVAFAKANSSIGSDASNFNLQQRIAAGYIMNTTRSTSCTFRPGCASSKPTSRRPDTR